MTYKCISRGEAKAKGLKRYFTGKPCKRGHTAERRVLTRLCLLCVAELRNSEKYKERRKERDIRCSAADKEVHARWYAANKERSKERGARWRAANKDRMKELIARWRADNKERSKETLARWQAANVDKRRASTAKRRSMKMKRTPPWADLKAIERFYHDAKVMTELTGELFHVDHVIPLQGKTVSGLHVETNLQILPGRENSSKGNKFVPQEAAQFT